MDPPIKVFSRADNICTSTMNFQSITLDYIRSELIRQEDTIIFCLIERCQFKHNSQIYKSIIECAFGKPTAVENSGETPVAAGCSDSQAEPYYILDCANLAPTLDLKSVLHELECVFSRIRRYTSPDELPFTKPLSEILLPPIEYPNILAQNNININGLILETYIQKIIPLICIPGSDGNLGSSCTRDVETLQALSRRIHMGLFVAEAKFNDTETHKEYCRLIKNRDRQGIMDLLTNAAVEERLLKRIAKKALVYGQEIDENELILSDSHVKIDPAIVVDMYRSFVIPLTKQVEVDYLLQRL